MANVDPYALVEQLAAQLGAAAADDHERTVFLFAAKVRLEQLWLEAAQLGEEQRALLVLEARAARPGAKSVAEQKAAVADVVKRHPSTVTAIECINVVAFGARAPTTPAGPRLEDQTTDPAPRAENKAPGFEPPKAS